MKKYLLFILVMTFFGCSETETPINDSIPENGIQIGDQIWMRENLKVKTFRNGDPIIESKSVEEWDKFYKEKIPAWTSYLWQTDNEQKFGVIYNYYAMIDPRGLAPSNWKIPTSTDFFELVEFNGGANVATKKLMSSTLWTLGNNGTNESGFDGRPGGEIWAGGIFTDINEHFAMWTNSKAQSGDLIFFGISTITETRISFSEHPLERTINNRAGFYIRCIKE